MAPEIRETALLTAGTLRAVWGVTLTPERTGDASRSRGNELASSALVSIGTPKASRILQLDTCDAYKRFRIKGTEQQIPDKFFEPPILYHNFLM